MAKAKSKKAGNGPHQKHLRSRIAYLAQAARHLATATPSPPKYSAQGDLEAKAGTSQGSVKSSQTAYTHSRHLLSHLRTVSQKAQIRLSPDLKHSFCRRCDSLLIGGVTSDETIANASRNKRKPWADVLVRTCQTCGATTRFPLGKKPKVHKRAESDSG
jgi:ribonuclease P protein subunit RPR2